MLRSDEVLTWIRGYLSDLLDIDAEEIKTSDPLRDFGMDSSDAVVLAGVMEEQFDLELEPALFLRNATLDDLITDLKSNGIVE